MTTTLTARVSSASPSLLRSGAVAGVAAAAATAAVAATAHGLGVSLETAPGQTIPVAGFAQMTLVFTAVGVLIARTIGRRAAQPRTTFTKTALVLTALSFVPDAVISAGVATKLTLMLTHVVAAAIVIPALSSRLPQHSAR
jgi:uncharacterized protein DUF6069